jgi:N-methylhydantoinase B
MRSINPITMETIKNRLVAIGQEMVITMVRTAGTPIYAEIKDFSCGLFDYQARQVVYSGMAVIHNVAIQNLVQTSIRVHGNDPGILNGDLFMGNDPYSGGGIHAPELGLAFPIFVDGEIVAWSGSIAHQLDIGGMTPGGFCIDATDCFQEGVRFPPVKLYREGKLQQDIWNIHRNNVRLPEKISMELKGQIAANNVAKRRIEELVAKFGVETFHEVCDALILLSAKVTEERIREIPEGRYEHVDFGEIEGISDGLLPIYCDLTVKDGKLIFDLTRDCPPQVPRPFNTTKTVTKGLILTVTMPLLSYDVPWNEGCSYPIKILTTPGTILDARPPGPCSCIETAFRAADAAQCALNKALFNSSLRDRMTACWAGSPPITLGMAPQANGHHPIIIPLLEGMSGGGGAFSMKDGLDAGSMLSIMEYSMGDVETQENAYPILFLTRRFLQDSGGPGRYRGGVGSLVAIVPHKTSGLRFILVEDRRLVPSHGTIGGYPGASHHLFVGRQRDTSKAIREGLGDTEEALSNLDLIPAIICLDLGPEDIFAFTSNAGGGFGDPLNRAPRMVARDILWKFVSHGKAREIYGVVFEPGTLEVDEVQTKLEREKVRVRRAPNGPKVKSDAVNFKGDGVILKRSERGIVHICSRCEMVLSALDANWKERVPYTDLRMDKTGVRIPGDDRVVLRQYICSDCGHLLDSEVTLRNLGPLFDFKPIK